MKVCDSSLKVSWPPVLICLEDLLSLCGLAGLVEKLFHKGGSRQVEVGCGMVTKGQAQGAWGDDVIMVSEVFFPSVVYSSKSI